MSTYTPSYVKNTKVDGIPPEATKRLIQRRLKVFGCTSSASQKVAVSIYVLLKNNGEFWTIQYLKSAAEKLKSLLGVTDTESTTWVSTKGKIPRVFLPLFEKLDVSSVSGRTLILRLTALPKAIKPKVVRQSDMIKLRSAIMRSPKEFPRREVSSLLRLGVLSMPGYSGLSSIESPSIFEMGGNVDFNDPAFLQQVAFAWRAKFPALLRTHSRPYWPFSSPEEFFTCGYPPEGIMLDSATTAGSIGITPEPGGKARLFASPDLGIGWLCYPLFKMSRKVLRAIPEDCTYDQSRFKERLLQWLAKGQVVDSVDQSHATDLFPLELQLEVGTLLGLPSSAVEEFGIISRLPYRVKRRHRALSNNERCISWTVGQPLGVYPSFNLYSLTHHALIRGIFKKLERPMNYVLLGDDIAICDRVVAEEYIRVLQLIGCDVNRAKSYTSNVYAEGAGYRVHMDVAVCPGRFPIPDEFNFQSFIKDPILRQEILVNLPTPFEDLFKDDGTLTRETVYKILRLQIENPDFCSALRAFTSRSVPAFQSPATRFPEIFLGKERQVDEKFIFPVVETLRGLYGKASKGLQPVISRLITEIPETSEIWIKSDESLVSQISLWPMFRDFRKIDPLTMTSGELKSFGFQWKAPKGDTLLYPLPRWAIELTEKIRIDYEALVVRKDTLMKMISMSMNELGSQLLDLESLRSDVSQVEKEISLCEYNPNNPYLRWWDDPNIKDVARGDYVSMGKKLMVLELAALFIELLQSNGALRTPARSNSYRAYARKLNNCLKLSGFRTVLRQFLA